MAHTAKERETSGDGFCETCKWFNWKDDDDTDISGYCRRYPPAFLIEKSVSDGFPNVRLTDWCGEYSKHT